MRTSLWGMAGTLLAGLSIITAVGVSAHVCSGGNAGAIQARPHMKAYGVLRPEHSQSVLTPAGMVASPETISSGQNSLCSVSLNCSAQTDTVVAIETDEPAAFASIPTSVTVPAGQISADFTVQAATVSSITCPTISANLNGGQASFTISVTP